MSKNQEVCTQQKSSQWIEDLRNSPIFNMSLGDKELFHSNFLAWAMEQYQYEAKKFFCDILNLKEDDCCKCECKNNCIKCIEREVKKKINKINTSIDLKFKIYNCTIFLENKFKSIAYQEQLDNYLTAYNVDQECNKFILLSLKTPQFFTNNIYKQNQKNWILVTYKQLVEEFYGEIVNNELDCYKKSLVQDYINFVCIIINQSLPVFNLKRV